MQQAEKRLFDFLDSLGIEHKTTRHAPLFSVADGLALRDKIPGLHCKTLFLKDGKGMLWLVVMSADMRADLAGIARQVGAAKLSFAKPELLMEILGMTPGSVTPFALLNDVEKRVNVALDKSMLVSEYVCYHPLHNAASTTLKAQDIVKFVEALGYVPVLVDCGSNE